MGPARGGSSVHESGEPQVHRHLERPLRRGATHSELTCQAGVAGYVFKGLSVEWLEDAIERVHAGQQVVELSTQPATAADLEARGWPGQELGLTARESEVVAMICQGLSNQQIADQAYLSINSVKTYIRTAYRKIGVSTRPHAIR